MKKAVKRSSRDRSQRTRLTLDLIYSTRSLGGIGIQQVAWSPDGKLVTYLRSEGPHSQVRFYDVITGHRGVLFDFARIQSRTTRRDPEPQEKRRATKRSFQTFLPPINTPAIALYFWSPTGRQLLVSLSAADPFYLLDLATEQLSLLIDSAASAQEVTFAPDGSTVSFVSNFNLFLASTSTGALAQATFGGSESCRYSTPDTLGDFITEGHWWSPDSSRIACLTNDERAVGIYPMVLPNSPGGECYPQRYPRPGLPGPAIGLVILRRAAIVAMNLQPYADYYLARVQWLPNSRHLSLQLMSPDQKHLVLLIGDSDTGACWPILEERAPDWVNVSFDPKFFSDGMHFLWTSERNSQRQIYLYRIDGMQIAQLTSGPQAVTDFLFLDEKNLTIYYQTYPAPYLDGHIQKRSFNIDGASVVVNPVESLTSDPGVHTPSFSPDYSYFADLTCTVVRPPHLDLYRTDGQRVAAIEKNEVEGLAELLEPVEFLPNLPAGRVGDPSDDMPLCGKIIRPPGARAGKRYPVIIYVYGGPTSQGTQRTVVNSWSHVPDLWLNMMAQRGYVTFALDNRGTCEGPRGHDFEKASFRKLGKVELADQLKAVEYLKSLPFVDGSRIGIFGGSFGGFMTLNAILRAPNVYKAAAAWAPVTNWIAFDKIYTEQYMDTPEDNADGYRKTQISPLAEALQGKLLLMHGGEDSTVHLNHTCELCSALNRADKDYRMMIYPSRQHTAFFEQTLLGKEIFAGMTRFFEDNL